MNVIENEIEAAIDKELQAATERFGLHHSNHEKYAVIIEELQECKDSLKNLEYSISDAWDWVKCDNERGVEECIDRAYNEAVNVAIEACQVAAMCKKGIAEQSQQEARWQVSSDGYYPYCPICGAQPDKKTKFCAECGAKLGE